MSTPTPTTTSSIAPMVDTRSPDTPLKADTPQKAKADTKSDTKVDSKPAASDNRAAGILPITGADMEPLVAAASICLLAGSAALVAGRGGRGGRVARATNSAGRRRRSRGAHR
jgi:hypothetical protein